jgi:hypothetical protein
MLSSHPHAVFPSGLFSSRFSIITLSCMLHVPPISNSLIWSS